MTKHYHLVYEKGYKVGFQLRGISLFGMAGKAFAGVIILRLHNLVLDSHCEFRCQSSTHIIFYVPFLGSLNK